MLYQFSVENYKSIHNKVILEMDSAPDKSHEDCLIYLNEKQSVLPAAVIYGANSAGKSNILEALMLMRDMVAGEEAKKLTDETLPYEPFAFSEEMDKPTVFEVIFYYQGVKYSYGFSYNKNEILSEYLYHKPNKREALVFSREGQSYKFMKNVSEQKALAGRTPRNRLYLVTSNEWNNRETAQAFRWFSQNLIPLSFGSMDFEETVRELADKNLRDRILKEMLVADLGITDILIPSDHSQQIQTIHKVKRKDGTVRTYPLYLNQESKGTQRYFSRIGYWLKALDLGGVLLVDELEASMHPLLTRHLIGIIMDKETNPNGAQLIFTTHDVNLLDQKLLRRDQVWFAEKNPDTAETELFALTDFSVRKDENIARGYLQGRYGAIPFISMEE